MVELSLLSRGALCHLHHLVRGDVCSVCVCVRVLVLSLAHFAVSLLLAALGFSAFLSRARAPGPRRPGHWSRVTRRRCLAALLGS